MIIAVPVGVQVGEGHERGEAAHARDRVVPWLRTNGVDTDGVAAKVIINVDRLWKKVRPGTFGMIKVG